MIRNPQIDQRVVVDLGGHQLLEGVIQDVRRGGGRVVLFVQFDGEEEYEETTPRYCYTVEEGLRLALQRAAGQDESEDWQ